MSSSNTASSPPSNARLDPAARAGSRDTSARTVLFIDHTAKLGGGEIALLNLVTHLDAARYRPIVMLFEEGPLADRLRGNGITVLIESLDASVMQTRKDTLNAGGWMKLGRVWTSVKHARRVAGRIRSLAPDLVHTNSLKADLIGGLAARWARVPTIWHVRDRIAEDYLPRRAVKLFRWLAEWVPMHVIANSHATLETLTPQRSEHPHFTVIHNGTVIHDGVPCPNEGEPASPNPKTVVGLVGRISPWKGQDILIRAAANLRDRGIDGEFRLIGAPLFGEEAYEQSLRTLAAELKVDDRIVFTGFRSDVPAQIAQLDIVVHASTVPEPFGQVIIEGMVATKPVIATRAGGVIEIVDDRRTGLLVKPGDVEELTNAIAELVNDPALAKRLAAAGRQSVRDRFTIDRVARDVEALYDRLLTLPTASTSRVRAAFNAVLCLISSCL